MSRESSEAERSAAAHRAGVIRLFLEEPIIKNLLTEVSDELIGEWKLAKTVEEREALHGCVVGMERFYAKLKRGRDTGVAIRRSIAE